MFGPRQMGCWSSSQAPNCGKEYAGLMAGRRYRVLKSFADYDGDAHSVGEEWVFLGYSFFPHEDGLSLFISLDGENEWMIRMQSRADQQGEVVNRLETYVTELPANKG